MITEIINFLDMLWNFIHEILLVLIPFVKFCFSGPMLPFTIMGIIGFIIKTKVR